MYLLTPTSQSIPPPTSSPLSGYQSVPYVWGHIFKRSYWFFFLTRLLERTIRSAVEQHLFDVNSSGGQSSEDSESGASSSSSTSTKQRRRQAKEQDEIRHSRDVWVGIDTLVYICSLLLKIYDTCPNSWLLSHSHFSIQVKTLKVFILTLLSLVNIWKFTRDWINISFSSGCFICGGKLPLI